MSETFRIIFRVKEYPSSLRFYSDLLECPIVMQWDRGPAEKGTIFKFGSGEIEVLGLPPGMDYVQPQGFEIAAEFEDVEKAYQFVLSKGIQLRGDIANKPWGHRTFSVNDPDGVKLIFYSEIRTE